MKSLEYETKAFLRILHLKEYYRDRKECKKKQLAKAEWYYLKRLDRLSDLLDIQGIYIND